MAPTVISAPCTVVMNGISSSTASLLMVYPSRTGPDVWVGVLMTRLISPSLMRPTALGFWFSSSLNTGTFSMPCSLRYVDVPLVA